MAIHRNALAAAFVIAGIGTAYADDLDPPAPAPSTRPDPSFQAGPVKLTPGGFFELTGIYRKRNLTADIGSSFGNNPFRNNPNYYTSEFRETARNSRFSLLAQGPSNNDNHIEAYLETDFVSAGNSSNSNESNSYTLRVRQAFLAWSRADLGWSILAGQAWSLATMNRKGLGIRQEDIPIVNDGQYYTGFVWTRQPQLRVVKSFTPQFALGLSLENPQNVVKGVAPPGTTATNPGGAAQNSGANYSTDIAPDVILKLAVDPGYGHYEIYSLTRLLHDRAPSTPGVLSSEANHTTVAQSFGAGMIVPLYGRWLDLHATTLIGRGNGRYGSAQLGDSTYNTGNGSISALREQQALVGLIGHPARTVDLYVYGGFEHQKSAYGLVPNDNSACDVNLIDAASLPASAGCGGVGTVRHIGGGVQWKFYEGALGYVHGGPEIEYLTNTTYTARNGTSGHTDNTMVFLTVRYFPFQ